MQNWTKTVRTRCVFWRFSGFDCRSNSAASDFIVVAAALAVVVIIAIIHWILFDLHLNDGLHEFAFVHSLLFTRLHGGHWSGFPIRTTAIGFLFGAYVQLLRRLFLDTGRLVVVAADRHRYGIAITIVINRDAVMGGFSCVQMLLLLTLFQSSFRSAFGVGRRHWFLCRMFSGRTVSIVPRLITIHTRYNRQLAIVESRFLIFWFHDFCSFGGDRCACICVDSKISNCQWFVCVR